MAPIKMKLITFQLRKVVNIQLELSEI